MARISSAASIVLSVMASSALAREAYAGHPAGIGERGLERVQIVAGRAWFFDFDVLRGPRIPAFVQLRQHYDKSGDVGLARFYLYGVTDGANRPGLPLRWDVTEGVLFSTYTYLGAHHPLCPSIQRYPLDALVPGADDGRGALDAEKVTSSSYVGCAPIGGALTGLFFGWNNRPSIGEPVKTVHYDIRAIDDARVELFMTADGELSRWLFDGKTWKNVKHYNLRVEGEFLVFDEGRALVSEAGGQWSVIPDIEAREPAFLPIVARVEGEPLTLVEDEVERSNFFLHRDKLLDDRGRELLTVGDARDHNERVRQVIDFVVSRRQRP